MSKKLLGFICCFCFLTVAGNAQENRNSVKLHFIGNYTPGENYNRVYSPKNFGLNFERKLGQNIAIGAKYSFWLSPEFTERFNYWGYHAISERKGEATSLNRNGYQFFDLYAGYSAAIAPKHALSLKAGPSLAYGNNRFSTGVNAPAYTLDYLNCFVTFEETHKKEAYFGGVVELSYDYFFWQNRLSAGADVSSRFYNKDFPLHFNYGLHAGFNF